MMLSDNELAVLRFFGGVPTHHYPAQKFCPGCRRIIRTPTLFICWVLEACTCFALLLRQLLLQRKFRKAVQCQQIDSDLLGLLSDTRPEVFKISIDFSGGADESEILQRFQMILQGEAKTSSQIRSAVGFLMCAVLFIASYCIILQPWTIPVDEQQGMYNEIAMPPGASYIVLESDVTLHLL